MTKIVSKVSEYENNNTKYKCYRQSGNENRKKKTEKLK